MDQSVLGRKSLRSSDRPPRSSNSMNCIATWGIKNYCWVWIAVDRLGKRFLHAVTGTRGVVTGARLWEAIESPMIAAVMTDYWEPYEQFVPSEKHRQSKAETFTVEGLQQLVSTFSGTLPSENEMLQQKRNHVAVFGHAVDGTMERRTRIYLKLTMPSRTYMNKFKAAAFIVR